MSLIDLNLSSIIATICFLYVGNSLLNKKINFKKSSTILGVLLSLSFLSIIYIYFESFFKILMNYILIGCIYKLIYEENIQKSFSLSFITVALYFISEIIVTVIFLVFSLISSIPLTENLAGSILINIAVSLFVIIFIEMQLTRKAVCRTLNFLEKAKSQSIAIVFVFIIGVLGRKNITFFGMSDTYVMNLIIIVLFIIVIYYFYKEKEISDQLSQKYDQLLNYIQKYEKEITNKNIVIHEFKNQIITIKTMVSKRDLELNKYIDSLINDMKNINENNLKGMDYIPQGGLKGLIYFKLGDLEEKGIKVETVIDCKIKKSSFCKNDINLYKNILKIIGVYLDNAIEACIQSEKKRIYLEIYCRKNESHFILSNTYKGQINIDNFDKIGYSTKGKGRGYGFRLVSQILDNYKNIKQYREVNDDYYTVHLVVSNK